MDFSEKELLSSEVAERKSSYWDKVPAATESLSLSISLGCMIQVRRRVNGNSSFSKFLRRAGLRGPTFASMNLKMEMYGMGEATHVRIKSNINGAAS